MKPAPVVLVNEQDQVLGTEEKIRAHEQGLLHRAFSVYVFDIKGNLLVQQRHSEKYHCGGLWTNTCCSHPRLDEEITAAGQRRLQEELGFTVPLTAVGYYLYKAEFPNGLTEHEYDHVLVGHYTGQSLKPNPEEVATTRWWPVEELLQTLAETPEQFTPWFLPTLKIALAM